LAQPLRRSPVAKTRPAGTIDNLKLCICDTLIVEPFDYIDRP
jgi:hypothetical protein